MQEETEVACPLPARAAPAVLPRWPLYHVLGPDVLPGPLCFIWEIGPRFPDRIIFITLSVQFYMVPGVEFRRECDHKVLLA